MSAPRNLTLDVAKGISILLMTICHLMIFQENSFISKFNTNYIFFFTVPIFVFTSGLLFVPKDNLKKFITNKFDSLLKPIVALAITFIAIITSIGLLNGKNLKIAFEKADLLLQNLFFPLWFPTTLFISILLLNLILYFSKKNRGLFYIVGISVILFVIALNNVANPSKLIVLDTVVYFLLLLTIGYIISIKNWIHYFFKTTTFILSCITLFIFFIFKNELNIKIDLYHNTFGNFIFTLISLILAFIILINISKLIIKVPVLGKVFTACSRASFYILAFHTVVGNKLIFPIFTRFLGNTVFCNVLQFIVTITICIFLYKVVFYIPFVRNFMLPKKEIQSV